MNLLPFFTYKFYPIEAEYNFNQFHNNNNYTKKCFFTAQFDVEKKENEKDLNSKNQDNLQSTNFTSTTATTISQRRIS